MRATDDSGVELNAEYSVEVEADGLALVLESAGGRVRGSPRPRNDDYAQVLTLLLGRLRVRDAILETALVDSRNVRELPEGERRLIDAPVELARDEDMEGLRHRLTSAQGRIGQHVGARKAGNARKRIRLRLTVPGYGPGDAARLETDLASPAGDLPSADLRWPSRSPEVKSSSPDTDRPETQQLLRSLIGVELFTVTGSSNRILSVDATTVSVATVRSPAGQPVLIAEVQAGLRLLAQRRSVRVSVEELGHRSAFVGAVLATLPGAVVTTRPAGITLQRPAELPWPTSVEFGILDGKAEVKIRKEQGLLRRLLAGDRASAECALCLQQFPMEFLVAAHIKRRAVCSDRERNDLPNIAMLVCTFGCDRLYELGYVTVDRDGTILTVPADHRVDGRFGEHLDRLQGHRCAAHRPASEPYFAWHRAEIFLGDETDPTV